jgi:hypothetical protein
MGSDVLLSSSALRSAADPFQNIARVTGGARVPLELVHIGRWLRLAMGAPTTTAAAPNYTHVFKDGSISLPSASIERAYTDKARYHLFNGVRVNTIGVTIAPEGSADATLGLLALKETRSGASVAGTPTVTPFTRFQRTTGALRRDAVAMASVTGGSFSFNNGMEGVATVSTVPGVEGIDFGQSVAEGSVDVRYDSDTLDSLASAFTPCALDYTLTINANASIVFEFPRVFLSKAAAPVRGPMGITASHRFRAAYDTTAACLMRVTLKNQTTAYA